MTGEADADPLRLAALGTVDLYSGRIPDADRSFRAALAQDPQQVASLWGLSLCLLKRNRVFEASALLDRASIVAPQDPRVKTLQAYAYCLLTRVSDAAQSGKAALDGGEKSPFLLATLAVIQRRMGYTRKALEFGGFAARAYYGMDFLSPIDAVSLPLTMTVVDTPQAVNTPAETKPGAKARPELELPSAKSSAREGQPLQIVAPAAGSTVRGLQRVQAVFRDPGDMKFLIFQVDGVLRGMITELPYHFPWDSDAAAPGVHTLCVRAYDSRGLLLTEDSISVTTTAGTPVAPRPAPARAAELQRAMMTLTMPAPAPLSLYTQLGGWHREVNELPQAQAAFEKAAAIDPTSAGVLTTLAALYEGVGLHPISATGEAWRGPAGSKRVALTFDDGPNPLYTPGIMEVLKQYDGRATFFLVGKMAQQYPDLVLELLAQGHELGNHSYTHPNITKLKQSELIAEVLRTRVLIKDISSRQTYLFRPPGGNIDEATTKQLRALDYNIVYWDVNAGEFKKSATPEAQTARMLATIKDGSIVLMHNGPVDGTLSILPGLMAALHAKGYRFVTVSELVKK
jgi:peptidoglycan/xylan/chitin deacetylase (PgdA/CDA1 family)